jgi:hypothetical protein
LRRSGVIRSLLVIGIVLAVGIAAVVHGVLGGDDAATASEAAAAELDEGTLLEGPDVPPPGALPGRLLFAADGCKLHRLELPTGALVPTALSTGCSFWPSPDGERAVVAVEDSAAEDGHDLWLAQLAGDADLVRLGAARGDVAWSVTGDRIAWCTEDGGTVLAGADGGELGRLPGCGPRFTAGGSLLTTVNEPDRRELLVDGEVLLDEQALREPLPRGAGRIQTLGYDQRDDGLLAVVVAAGARSLEELVAAAERQPGPFGQDTGGENRADVYVAPASSMPRVVLELWRDGRLEQAVSLRGLAYPFGNLRFGEIVRFSPGGRELAVGAQGLGVPLMLLDSTTLDPLLRPVIQDGFAWSPDGAWFAVSGSGEIRIAGTVRSTPSYVLPIGAATLAWHQ